jgi:hypothetical protein
LTTREPRNSGLRALAETVVAGVWGSLPSEAAVFANAVPTEATGDAVGCAPSRGGCPDAVAAVPALREAPDNHTAEPPAMTPNANALSVTADIDVRAATCLTSGRPSDRTNATTRRLHAAIPNVGIRDAGSRDAGSCHAGRRNVGRRHVGRRQIGRRHAGRRNVGRRNSRKRNLGTRQLGRCQVGTAGRPVRRGHRCHTGACQAGTRHAGNRHLGMRNLRTADATKTHEAAAKPATRRDTAIRTANTRSSSAIVRPTNRRRAV